MPTTHVIPMERRTLHGHFSPDLAPILTVQRGDTVVSSVLDANWYVEKIRPHENRELQKFPGRVPGLDDGHAMIGPIYVKGAQPGQTLAVHIRTLTPGPWGWSAAGGYNNWINRHFGWTEFGDRTWHIWDLDMQTMTGRSHTGNTVTLRPFLGLIGMPPPESGIHSTTPPRVWGGNLDCRSLIAG